MLQSQLKDMSGSVLAANQARREAEEGLTNAEDAKRKADSASAALRDQVKDLEAKLQKAQAQVKVRAIGRAVVKSARLET